MTKSNSSASSMLVPQIFVIHLVNSAQFLNATPCPLSRIIVTSPVTMK